MTQKTVAFFSGYYLPFLGGIERYTDKLTEELMNLGYRIVLVVSQHDESLPTKEIIDGRIIYRLPSKNLVKQRYPILDKRNPLFKEMMAELDAESIDMVICNTRFQLTTLIGLSYAKRHQIPSLVLDHGSSHFSVGNKILDVFGAWYEHVLTIRVKSYHPDFYAVSERSADWLKHFKIQAKGVIYNSVPASLITDFAGKSYKDKADNQLFITYAGRIIKEKGVELLLEAFQAADFSDRIHLQIAGDGPDLDRLKTNYSAGNIHFLGKLNFEETMSLMSQSDIFVYPSMYPEGLPTSILEAGLLGNAVIATDRGGTVEVINHPDLGIIIEENVSSLQTALVDLVADSKERQGMQEQLQDRILHHFTWRETARVLQDIIEEKTR